MKVGIITNFLKSSAEHILTESVKILKSYNAEIYASDCEVKKFDNIKYLPEKELFNTADVFVAIGGDGTIIHNAKKAAMYGKAVLGINAGRVGFLAGLEPTEICKISKLVEGGYYIENRMLLSLEFDGKKYYALNDAVVSNGKISKMIDITAKIGEEKISYRADGLIAATPTGSTAYSLSAGGPIVDYAIESIVLTPISPQSLFARTILLNAEKEVEVTAVSQSDDGVYLTVDGETSFAINRDTNIVISKEKDIYIKLIKLNDGSFITNLSKKFNLLG